MVFENNMENNSDFHNSDFKYMENNSDFYNSDFQRLIMNSDLIYFLVGVY